MLKKVFNKIELLPNIELKNLEKKLLAKQLKYVFRNSIFYQKKWSEFKNEKEIFYNFKSLKFTKKEEILEDQSNCPNFGNNLCVGIEKIIRIQSTSGTTNKPLYIPLTKNDIKNTIDSGSRCFWAAGLRPTDVIIHCLNYCLWMGGYTDHQSLENTGAAVIPFGVGNTEQLIKTIFALKPTAIHCTPSYLSKIEQVLSDKFNMKPSELNFKKGLFGGEPFFQNMKIRKIIEDKWKFIAMNANYGVSEVLSMIGGECKIRDGLHFMGQGNILVELLEHSCNQIIEIKEGAIGEFVLTNLNKEAAPLVRYRTNDLIQIISTYKCKCGRTSFRFKILGRTDDMLVIKGINIYPTAVRNVIIDYFPYTTGEFRIILEGLPPYEECTLLIEFDKISKDELENLKLKLVQDLKIRLGIYFKIEVANAGELERTAGKTKYIIFKAR